MAHFPSDDPMVPTWREAQADFYLMRDNRPYTGPMRLPHSSTHYTAEQWQEIEEAKPF